jgi:hypothetical protein
MALKRGALLGALMFAVVRSIWPGEAAANAYDVVIVSVDRLTDQFVPDLQGVWSGAVTTTNLPLLNQTSASYSPVTSGSIGGSWKLSDGGVNAIGGSFQRFNPTYSSGFAPTSGTITLDNAQSAGAYSNVVGGGSFEAFTRSVYDPFLNQAYTQSVTITRLQFTAEGPDQIDHRGVAVSSRVAFNNDNTRHGMNIGVPTSNSHPIVETSARSEYDYSTLPTHGESFLRNDTGDSEHWSFVVDPSSGQDMGSFLFHYFGTATFLDGTGIFAGNVSSSEWESFEVGTGQIAPNVWGAAVVTIDRYTGGPIGAVPEPETYMLMLAGLGLVAAIAQRRQNPV